MRNKSIFIFMMALWMFRPVLLQADKKGLAVCAARIYIGNGQVAEKGTLLIEDGKIQGISASSGIPDSYEVLDLGQKMVLPGLVDSHTHLGELPFPENLRTGDINESSQALTPMVDIRDALNYWSPTTFDLALAAGVTTVVALPGSSNVIGGLGTVIKLKGKNTPGRVLKPEGILKIALGENPKSSGKTNSRAPRTRMGVRFLLWKSFLEAKEYQEKWDRHDRNPDQYPKPELDLAKEPLRRCLQRKMQVHVHCARADDILIACDLAREFNLDVTLDHAYEGYLVADQLAKWKIPVITGPDLSGWKYGREPDFPVNVSGILADAGVKTAIMTDGIHYCDLLLQASYAVKLGMKETDALRAITLNAAEIAQVGDRLGSLEPGKDADFVVIDGPPFEVTTRVISVFVEGAKVFAAKEGN